MAEERDGPLEFPCTFPIKAMGRAGKAFESEVVEIVRRHAPDMDDRLVRVRESRGGKWLSVTVTIEATSREQLDEIYRELSAHEGVVWAM
jgi:putative lipoic acid-binding regulatory protein